VNTFLLALQFLTRIPLPLKLTVSDQQWGRTVLYYPLVGLVLGGILTVIAEITLTYTVSVQGAIILTVWVLMTGGLHLDGLADCTDGWAGGLQNRARTFEIMKDPHIGSIAVVVLMLTLGLKWAALSELLTQDNFYISLLIIPVLGRCAILLLMISTDYVRQKGLASTLNNYFPKKEARGVLVISAVLGVYSLGFWVILSAVGLLFLIRLLSQQRLGGVTGDVYGASVELVETILLLAVL
jgi:adenosylcobinamide-GDP ribazoletransferase